MSDMNDAAITAAEEQAQKGFRGPPMNGPSGESGGYIIKSNEAEHSIQRWLEKHGVNARAYSASQFDEFIQHIAEGRFMWIVVESSGYALMSPWFDSLFRAAIETDTEIWTANDDIEFGLHLFCSMMSNWEFLTPYVPEATQSISLTTLRDALTRIEHRIQANKSEAPFVDGISVESTPTIPQSVKGLIVRNGLVIDPNEFTVACREQKCCLGNTILFGLAKSLGRAPSKWHSFDELRLDVWKDEQTEDSTIGRTLRLLRHKLNKAGITGIIVENSKQMKKHARLHVS